MVLTRRYRRASPTTDQLHAMGLQGTAPFDGFQLYKNVAKRASRKIRYKGCFTDGGVDEQRMEYWVNFA